MVHIALIQIQYPQWPEIDIHQAMDNMVMRVVDFSSGGV
jgi:hypothetical protein